MELILERDQFTRRGTTGILSVNGVFECFILEPTCRPAGVKMDGRTAIPPLRYRCSIYRSPRFKCEVLLVRDVPGFAGVEFHPGNYPWDTQGCLLPGTARDMMHGVPEVRSSRIAWGRLMRKARGALEARDEIWLTIAMKDPPEWVIGG